MLILVSIVSEILKAVGVKAGFAPTLEFGLSGTNISGGIILEEEEQNLTGIQGAETFDMMRRTDSQIAMVLDVIKSPIKTAQFIIEPVDESDQAREDAELIDHILFNGMESTWQQFLTEYLSIVEFGFAMFEINLTNAVNVEFGQHIGLRTLAWRSPKTIQRWNVKKNGDLESVEQQVTGDISDSTTPVMPADKLLLFSYNREGDNFEGISLLRAIHPNYIAKRNFKKIQEIGSKRAATGVPVGKFPASISEPDRQAFIDGIKNISSGEKTNHVVFPTGAKKDGNEQVGIYDFDIKTMSHDSSGLNESIERENREIANRAMQGFMVLGQGGSSGSYALGTDLSDIFLGNIESYPNLLTDVINHKLIPFLIDVNRGKRSKYPKLAYSGVNDKAGKELIEILSTGSTSGLIQVTPKLVDWVHASFGLPSPDKPDVTTPSNPKAATENEIAEFNDKMQAWSNRWGGVQFAQVDLNKKSPTANLIDSFEVKYEKVMVEDLTSITTDYIDRVTSAVVGNPVGDAQKNARQIEFKGRRAYEQSLDLLIADQLDRATRQASAEFDDIKFSSIEDVSAPRQSKDKVKTQRQSIVDSQFADIKKIVIFQVGNTYDKDSVGEETLKAALTSKTNDFIRSSTNAGSTNLSASTTNTARNAVYQTPDTFKQIDSFIFVNHDPKSAICKNLAGRVFSKAEYETTNFLPQLHHKCKSYIVAQRINQSTKRDVDQIGLGLTGTEDQQEATLKSATFVI